MAFKSFKCKFYSKGYHSSAQKQTTAFFESSYQYLRRNQGVVSQESHIPSSHNVAIGPNPVVVANVNYNNVEHVLETEAGEEHGCQQSRPRANTVGDEFRLGRSSRRASFGGATASGQARDRYRSISNTESIPHYANPRHLVINQRLSRSYFSTAAAESSGTQTHDGLPASSITVTETTVVPQEALEADLVRKDEFVSPWESDTEQALNPSSFLQTQTNEIKKCYAAKDYNQINALFQSLQRNEIVPPIEIYEIVIESVCKRDLDNDNVDNRMFQLLNCYQDLIKNKIKPTEHIYNLVIGGLLQGSILAYELNNGNGYDFYKIAVGLFQASNAHKSHEFTKDVLDCSLLAMNLYPGHVEYAYVKGVLNSSKLYVKDPFYYVSLMTYAKNLNDNAALKELYEEFRNISVTDTTLQTHQYEVYSAALSGLVETGDMALAIKLLDSVLTDAKDKVGLATNVTLVLTNFLLSVSKLDCQKAYDLWLEFKILKWIPEFSYNFYLALLSNSLGDWKLAKKIYDYMFPMTRECTRESPSLSDRLLQPRRSDSMLSSFLDYALQLNDTEVVMKLLEESIVKKFGFDMGVYSYVFQFLKNIHCPDDYLLRFINSHGQYLSHSNDRFELLNGLIDSFQSQVILNKVTEMKFFVDACNSLNVTESRVVNYSGLIACFQSLWRSPQTIEKYSYNIELHGIVICKLYDPEGYYAVMENEYLLQFKERLTERFEKLMTNYKRLNLDPSSVSGVPVQAAKLICMPEELVAYFAHPGDWDKSYPLCLGSMLRNSFRTGLKNLERLRSEGYCFDYDTYKELINQKVNDADIVQKALDLCPDELEKRYLCNNLVTKTYSKELEEKVLKHPLFKSDILPYLKDASYVRLAKNVSNIKFFNDQIEFPKRFKSIAVQAEHKATTQYIYEQLYRAKEYEEVLKFNEDCPVLNVQTLLKSCIRSGRFDQYKNFLSIFKKSLGPEALHIHAEYLISNRKLDEAVKLLRSSTHKTEHKTNDFLSFALFLKSFKEPIAHFETVENTLQLANVLSTQETFASMISVYQTLTRDSTLVHSSAMNEAMHSEIVEQMLNNLHDSLAFLNLEDESVKNVLTQKVTNYFRFRMFLKLPVLSLDEVNQMLNIYTKVKESAIDTMFNNVVETIYLNPNTRILYLHNGMSFNFKPKELVKVVNKIEDFYSSEGDQENVEKTRKFVSVLKQLYHI